MARSEDVLELRTFVEEKYGRLDILVNNAASHMRWGNAEDLSEQDWDLTMNVDLKGPFLMIKYFIPLLRKSKNPSIVNISSSMANTNWPNNTVYSTAKVGLEKLTRQVTRDFFWLRCNAIQPGTIDTPGWDTFLTEEEKKAIFERYIKLIPTGRIGKPADIAHCVLFLSSPKGSYINGATILIDGGLGQNWLPEYYH